jgi:hypothetical protein
MDALRLCPEAIREHMPQLRKVSAAVLFHELRDAAAPAARLGFDRQGRDAEIRERVGVISRASWR